MTCQWCSKPASDVHHLFRRSARPDLIDDPENKSDLCRRCHDRATKDKDFERLLQEVFFLRKDRFSRLSVEVVQEALRSGDIIAPHDMGRFIGFLAGEYSFLAGVIDEPLRVEALILEEIRQRDDVKSDTRAKHIFETTEVGTTIKVTEHRMKRIGKLLDGCKKILSIMEGEARNQF